MAHEGEQKGEGQGKSGHSAMLSDFKRRFILSAIATVPVLAPAIGALIMSVSTVIVAINAKMTSYE